MKIGIYGGSFNPIHLGHLIISEYVRVEAKLDKIIFIPVGIPSHRENNLVSNKIRYNMIEASIKDNPFFEVSDIEIKQNKTCYTYDTLKKLKKKYPDDQLFEIIGEDSAIDLPNWKNINKLKKMTNFIVFKRKGYNYQKSEKNILVLDNPIIEISATNIRNRIKLGKSIRYLVPEGARRIIKRKELYLG
ncbi:MAG: nicotinate-nucleotide adenylyltransferase [Fusobacteriota bacterium]